MTVEDRMTIDERFKYLRTMKTRYLKAGRKERGQLLNEMEAVTGLHRKSLIRSLKGPLTRQPRARQRDKTYKEDVTAVLRVAAASLDHPCAERLTPNLVWLTEHLVNHGELTVSASVLEQLAQISVSTVERRLSIIRQDQPRRKRKPPPMPNQALRDIPVGRIPWDEAEPGHFEADLVHHSGPSASGQYVHTLQLVDVATGWTERQAILGRSYVVMEDAFRAILERIPFTVQEVHPDNGSEFFNNHIRRFWKEKAQDVRLSRSRPYHKNDNPFVEQRNSNPVRTYLGYDRLDTVEQTKAVNDLYDQMRLYHNLFQPVMRVAEKTVVSEPGQPTRIRRRYDDARTPFDRLLATESLSPEQRAMLTALRKQTNPLQLLNQIQEQLARIFALPPAQDGEDQIVYDTLTQIPDPRLEDAPVG
jgi:hypothetical protein